MTEQEISDNKILVAKFMGYQLLTKKYESRTYNSSNEFYYELNEGEIVCDENGNEVNFYNDESLYSLEDIPFNTWDVLMEVVEKIEFLGFNTFINYDINIRDNKKHICQISDHIHANYPYIYIRGVDKITSVYMAVVEFIKWYTTIEDESK